MIQNLLPGEREADSDCLVLSLMAVPRNADVNKKLNGRAKDAEASGMVLKSRSGYETQWYFDPTNPTQAAAAIKGVGARVQRVRNLSDEQKDALRLRLASSRASGPTQDRLSA